MSWKKIHGDPKIGNISPKDHSVLHMQFVADVAATLIICVALLMPGGVSPVLGETLVVEPVFMEVTEFELMGVTEFEFMRVTKQEFMGVTGFEFMGVTEFGFLVPTASIDGVTVWAGNRENVAYLRCAKLKEFRILRECALDALGMTQEEVDRAAEEWRKR